MRRTSPGGFREGGRSVVVAGVLLVATTLGTPLTSAAQGPRPVRVRVSTELGSFDVDIDERRAPITATNFLHYVDEGLYEGGSFFRTVRDDNQPDDEFRIQVIQGTIDRAVRLKAPSPIRLEGTDETGLTHLDGTISMARAGPDTGRADFFICIGDQPELDAGGRRNPDGLGFAAFGRVVRGMDVVRAIQASEAEGQRILRPVRIDRMERISG